VSHLTQPGVPLKALVEAMDAAVSRHVGVPPAGLVPGAVVLVVHRDEEVVHRAYGHAQSHFDEQGGSEPRPMVADTVFDLASLTKVVVTTAAIMRLVAEGTIALDRRVADFLEEFRDGRKAAIRLRDLLTHRAGLWEWWPLYVHATNRDEAVRTAASLPLRYQVGEERHYSDLSMILAGAVVEMVTGERLDAYARRSIFEPLGLHDTGFVPRAEMPPRCAATSIGDANEQHMLATDDPYPTGMRPDDFNGWRTHTLVGEVNDGNAHHALGGVGGHAGLFSTARDLARFGQMLLGRSMPGGLSLSEEVVAEFTSPGVDDGQGLGFWTNRWDEVGLGTGGFGHGGFTGAQFLVDPVADLVVVLLTNRIHRPLPYPSIVPMWRDVLATTADFLRD
jgi:serine-type D-Ala-D-Ala carboxypeptidase